MSTKIQLQRVTLKPFFHLYQPEEYMGTTKYKADFRIDPSTEEGMVNLAAIQGAIDVVTPPGTQCPNFMADGHPDYDPAGSKVIKPKSTKKPAVVGHDPREPLAQGTLKAGDLVNVQLTVSYSPKGKGRVYAILHAVQYVKAGELGEGTQVAATDVFDVLEDPAGEL